MVASSGFAHACSQPWEGCPAPVVLWAALAPGEGSLPSKRHGQQRFIYSET